MKCGYSYEDIDAYMEGILSIEDSESIKEHMKQCSRCRNDYDALMLTRSYLEAEMKPEWDVRSKVLQSIDREKYRGKRPGYFAVQALHRLKPVFLAGSAVAAAAVILLAAVFVSKSFDFSRIAGNRGVVNPVSIAGPEVRPQSDGEGESGETPSLLSKTRHFSIYFSEADRGNIDDIAHSFELGYNRISTLFEHTFDGTITVRLYADKNSLCRELTGSPPVPDREANREEFKIAGAITGKNEFVMLSPGGKTGRSFADGLKVGTNMICHLFIKDINPSASFWLEDGACYFSAGQLDMLQSTAGNTLKLETAPSLAQLDEEFGDASGLNFKSYSDCGGQLYSAVFAEYITKEFGFNKLVELLKSSGDYKGTVGLTRDELNKRWKVFLKANGYGRTG